MDTLEWRRTTERTWKFSRFQMTKWVFANWEMKSGSLRRSFSLVSGRGNCGSHLDRQPQTQVWLNDKLWFANMSWTSEVFCNRIEKYSHNTHIGDGIHTTTWLLKQLLPWPNWLCKGWFDSHTAHINRNMVKVKSRPMHQTVICLHFLVEVDWALIHSHGSLSLPGKHWLPSATVQLCHRRRRHDVCPPARMQFYQRALLYSCSSMRRRKRQEKTTCSDGDGAHR